MPPDTPASGSLFVSLFDLLASVFYPSSRHLGKAGITVRCLAPSSPSMAVVVVQREPTPANKKVVQFPAPAKVKNPAAVALGKLSGSKGGKIGRKIVIGSKKRNCPASRKCALGEGKG